jgi:hypothetical protein
VTDLPPPAPKPKCFTVVWSAGDVGETHYRHITGSNISNGLLFLKNSERESIINLSRVELIEVEDEP